MVNFDFIAAYQLRFSATLSFEVVSSSCFALTHPPFDTVTTHIVPCSVTEHRRALHDIRHCCLRRVLCRYQT
ncbi:hypothetical protein Y032_0136g1954 [Ancylostoma ceylanicum]|uniref:Uncharacterized protein n=1 Tax=Ancylostoma ceylanicum TaxID=53326 RepID=A0A016T5C4_9BILA|nr:hypothetical protein Y032_0136g1954 [Ancylostoma ceylanicum]